MLRREFLALLGVGLLGAVLHSDLVASAQESPYYVTRLEGSSDGSLVPIVVADGWGRAHAFVSENTDRVSVAVVYWSWSSVDGWSSATDVVLTPDGHQSAVVTGAVIGDNGRIHLMVHAAGSGSVSPGLYYTTTTVAAASDSKNWSDPIRVGEGAASLPTGALAMSNDGTLYAAYSSVQQYAEGVVILVSRDDGFSWLQERTWSDDRDDGVQPYGLQVVGGTSGYMYVTWTLVGDDGNGKKLNFVSREPISGTWSEITQLAAVLPEGYEVDWLGLTEYQEELLAVYNGDGLSGGVTTRWFRRSGDHGLQWSNPVRLSEHVGEYGFPRFFVGGDDVLRMVLGSRTADGVHGLWWGSYDGGEWSEITPLISGQRSGGSPADRFDPTHPSVATPLGSVVLVLRMTDSGVGGNGVWALEVPLEASPAPTALGTPVSRLSEDRLSRPSARRRSVDGKGTSVGGSRPYTRVIELNDGTSASGRLSYAPALFGVLTAGVVVALAQVLVARRRRSPSRDST